MTDVFNHTHDELGSVVVVEEIPSPKLDETAVAIARINADLERDRMAHELKLARINAGVLADEVLVEAAVDQARAEGEASGLREAIAPPEPMPEPDPVAVMPDPEPEPEPTIEPADEPSEPSTSHRKSVGLGMW